MKKVAIITALLCLLVSGTAFAAKIPPPPSYIIQATDCAFLTWFGALCHDVDDGKLYKWDGATQVELAAAAGAGDISDVWNCSTGDCQDLTAGAADSLNATAASYSIPWVVAADCSAVVAEGRACWDSDDNVLYVGDAAAALSISNPLGATIESAEITNDTIVNADINTAAAIAWSKMAALTSANILLGSAGNVATVTPVTGDISIDNAGLTAVVANAVALATDTTGNYVATIADAGSAVFTVANSGTENAAVTLDVATGGITSTHILDNTVTATDLNAALTFADGDILDLSGITHTGATDEGLVIPTWANVAPTSDKKFLAADGSNLKLYNGGWVTIGSTAAPTDATYLTLTNDATLSGERVLTAGTNGIDFADTGANGTLTINTDTTEIGTTTWGAGAAITWTFDASAGTDPTLVFGDGAVTASVLTVTGALTANGGIVMGTGDGFTVNSVNLLSGDELDGTKIKDADYGDVTVSAGGAWAVEDDSHAHTSTTITLASTNLSDTANVARLDASNTFTGTTNTVGNANTDIMAVQATARGVGRAFTIDDDTTTVPTYATGTNELFVEGDIETDGNIYASGSFIGGAGVDGARGITFTTNTALTPTADQIYFINDALYFSQAGAQKTPMRLEDTQTVTGIKTFENGFYIGDTDTTTVLRLYDGSTNYWSIAVPAMAGNYTLTLPVDDGTANQALITDGAGALSWSTMTATAAGATAGMVQYNATGAGGALAADAGFIFTTASDKLTLGESGGSTTGTLDLYYTGTTYAATVTPNSAMAGDVTITLPSYTSTLLGGGANTFTGEQVLTNVAINTTGATLSGTIGTMNGSDTFKGIFLDYTNANHSSTGNTVALIDIDAIAGDAEANLYGIRIGNLTGTTGSASEVENAIKVGTGWDVDLELADNTATITHTGTTSLTIASTSGTVIVEGLTVNDTAITGATSITSTALVGTLTGSSDSVAMLNETTDTTCFPAFVTTSTPGDVPLKTDTALTYNSNGGVFGATSLQAGVEGVAGQLTIYGATSGYANITPAAISGTSLITLPAASGVVALNPMTTAGDLVVGGVSGAPARLAAVAAGQPLLSGGVGVASAYAGYTFAGTAAQTYTFPGATASLAPLDSPTFTTTMGMPAAMTGAATTAWTLVDGQNAALTLRSTGAEDIIKVTTTDGTEGVSMSKTLTVTGHTTFEGVTSTGATGTGKLVYDTTPTLVTPVIGAATGTSLIATGIVDGLTNVTLTTDGSEDANVTGKMSHVIINKHTTEATAFAVSLPATAIAGMQLLVKNGYGDDAPTTGVITVYVPATHYAWNPTTKTQCAQGYDLVSGGAAGDYIGMVAISADTWESIGYQGTWTCTVTP